VSLIDHKVVYVEVASPGKHLGTHEPGEAEQLPYRVEGPHKLVAGALLLAFDLPYISGLVQQIWAQLTH
tara:strand:+ start:305 stop:511 length:207 start_codon:yes stop_codon:yes gene_type:complete